MAEWSTGEIDLIANVDLFQKIPSEERKIVLEAAHRRGVPRYSFFFHEGEEVSCLYILVQGQVKIIQTTAEGHQVTLRTTAPGQMFGGVAILGYAAYPVSAQALTDCQSLSWDGSAMKQLLERFPRIALSALDYFSARLQEMQDRYRELATERVERRVARALLRLVHQAGRRVGEGVRIDMPLSRQDLAEMTGTTLYTVSRILSGWEEKGLVSSGREQVTILAPHELVVIAEDLIGPPTALDSTVLSP